VHGLSDARANLLKNIDEMSPEIVQLTSDLIKFPTVNPPGENYEECSKFIAKKLREAGLDVQVVEVPNVYLNKRGLELPRYCVLGRLVGTEGKPILHVNGHYDVVAAGSGWTVPPFEGMVRESKIFGRGASDMKGGISSSMMAICALRKIGYRPRGTLLISATPDEEIGGRTGTGYLVENGLANADMAILNETGGVDKISVGYRGALWLEIKTLGRVAHGSRPHEGINAIEKMAELIDSLKAMKGNFSERKSRIPITPEESRHPTLNIGLIRGGLGANIVPDECTVTVDRRLIPEENSTEVMKEIQDLLAALGSRDPEFKAVTKEIFSAEPALSSDTTELAESVKKNIIQVVGKTPSIRYSASFSDFRFFAREMGVPTVNYGPGIRGHVPDEYVNIPDLVAATKVLALTIMDLLG
jgi:succinyl-diaminopimelate desuccinylase